MKFKTNFAITKNNSSGRFFQVQLNSEYAKKYEHILKHHNIKKDVTKGIKSVDSFFLKKVIADEYDNIIKITTNQELQ